MKLDSPLRYPGGKGALTPFLAKVIEINSLRGCSYYEPYAGGAGAALGLLKSGAVSEVHINDADFRIYAFWKSVLENSERFVDRILSVPLTINEWRAQREICARPENHDTFTVGFATFYMNRCNRSGVLRGAGPIGGLEQAGKWKLDVRFSRGPLANRVESLGSMADRIHVSNLDAIDFIKTKLPKEANHFDSFVYLDPPYVVKGRRLYLNTYQPEDHAAVAAHLAQETMLSWIMSYDDDPLVRDLYATQRLFRLPIKYALQSKRVARELIIAPEQMIVPETFSLYGREVDLPPLEAID